MHRPNQANRFESNAINTTGNKMAVQGCLAWGSYKTQCFQHVKCKFVHEYM